MFLRIVWSYLLLSPERANNELINTDIFHPMSGLLLSQVSNDQGLQSSQGMASFTLKQHAGDLTKWSGSRENDI